MVAVISSGNLGVYTANGSTRGTAGTNGSGKLPDQAYVNTTTGNLVIQQQDEWLASLGLDLGLVRTYNSQGLMDDDNADNWRLGLQQRVYGLTGTLNQANSTIRKVFGDGADVLYTYNVALQKYVGTDGDGAHDTLSYDNGTWTWTDGSSQFGETYDWVNDSGKIQTAFDTERDGANTVNRHVYSYSGNRLTSVQTVSSGATQTTTLEYEGDNLARLVVSSGGNTQTRTRYFYDDLDRLRQVVVDLTPTDNTAPLPTSGGLVQAVANETFITRYTYDGDSKRVASITQGDGTTESFDYDFLHDAWRVTSYTDGLGRTTTLSYAQTTPIGGGGGGGSTNQTASANQNVLQTTEMQEVTYAYLLDTNALSSMGGGGGNVLINNVSVSGLSAAQGQWVYYTITVPTGATGLTVTTTGGSGDADFYVRHGSAPTQSTYDTKSDYNYDAEEGTYVEDPAAGVWHIGVFGYESFSGVQLEAHYTMSAPQEPVLTAGVAVNDISGTDGFIRYFRVDIPTGVSHIGVTLSGTNGDADLYVMQGEPVNLANPHYYGEGYTSNEFISANVHWPESWYIAVRSATPFSDASLVVHFNPGGNAPPVVNAGLGKSASSGTTVALNAVASDAEGGVTYQWTQISGPSVSITNATSANASFVAPTASSSTVLTFRVQVTDAQGLTNTDTVSVTVGGGGLGYLIPSGATWQSVANALYHVNSAATAAALLETLLGSPSLTAGTWLINLPELLDFTTLQSVTVPHYYIVPSNPNWVDVTNVIYNTTHPGAVLALQTATGNPQLIAGMHLTVPLTLDYSTSIETANASTTQTSTTELQPVTVPAYYTVLSNDTWTTITDKIYGTTHANAIAALQVATNNPTLTTGLHLTVPLTLTYEIPGSGGNTSPVTATYYDDAGRVTGRLHQDGLLTTYRYNSSGTLLDSTEHATAPSAPLWSQDFSSNADGITPIHSDFMSLSGSGLNVTSRDDIDSGWVMSFGDRTYNFGDYINFRAEVTTGSSSDGRRFNIGAENTDESRRHSAYFAENQLIVSYFDGSWVEETIGEIDNNTTYVVEVDTHASGSTLYVYEKGTSRQNGYIHNLGYTDWGNARFFFETQGDSGLSQPSNIRLDNMSESPHLGALVGPWIARESAQDQIISGGGSQTINAPADTGELSTTEWQEVQVPRYYVVVAGDNWELITQKVYGTSDPNAVQELKDETGEPTLTTGMHLEVPDSIAFNSSTSGGGAPGMTAYRETKIFTPENATNPTIHFHDEQGRLTSVRSPTVGGATLRTDYTYDSDGNINLIVEDPAGLNRRSTFLYENGNLKISRDPLGNTVERTYSATNQLLSETRYLTPDPDAIGSGSAPSGAMTTRYVYDGEDHLRFIVSAEGRVTEYGYRADGLRTDAIVYAGSGPYAGVYNEAALQSWAGSQSGASLSQLQRVKYEYDFRGLLFKSTAYEKTDNTGAGLALHQSVTHYIYDQRGQLLQTITPLGASTAPSQANTTPVTTQAHSTTYTYDGLGRLLTTHEWVDASLPLRSTSIAYLDNANTIQTTIYNGVNGANTLTTTSVYNAAGNLLSTASSGQTSGQLGVTTYSYDADGRLRFMTDATGIRQHVLYDEAGRKVAEVDGDGSLTEFVYNAASQVVKTIRYAVRIPAANLVGASNALVTPAGALNSSITLTNLKSYIGRSSGPVAADDQIFRSVYDNAGRLKFSVDEVGAVTEYLYDGANRVHTELHYANSVTIGTAVNELLTVAVAQNSQADRRTRHFYDNDGNLLGTLDSMGYLVEFLYDPAGFLSQQIGRALQTAAAYWQAGAGTWEEVKTSAGSHINDIQSNFFYDGQGRRIGVVDGEGYFTETRYYVDGRVSQTIRYDRKLQTAARSSFSAAYAAATAAPVVASHTTNYQYNGAGQVTRQTNFEGTHIDFEYDTVGNVVRTTMAATDSADERTVRVRYDELGRVKQELSGEGARRLAASEITEAEAWDWYGTTYAYDLAGRRVSATNRAQDPIIGLQPPATTHFYYNEDNQLRFTVNALGERTEMRYNALGQLTEQVSYVNRISTSGLTGGLLTSALTTQLQAFSDSTRDAKTTFTYTLRGELKSSVTQEGATITNIYDAFGDLRTSFNVLDPGRGLQIEHHYEYDRRGQLKLTHWDPNSIDTTETRTYDAFGRLTHITDHYGNVTRSEYDHVGRVIATYDALNHGRSIQYDAFSRTLQTVDANNNLTTYQYNDTTRQVQVTSPKGVVTQVHNRHGQTVSVTNQSNAVTTTTYNDDGQVIDVTIASGTGDASTTRYTYDSVGSTVTVTEGFGTAQSPTVAGPRLTEYRYDAAGRRTHEIVKNASLHGSSTPVDLITEYRYDGKGNLTRKIDPKGYSTWYVYDRDNRLTQTIDALGGVTQTYYNNAGMVIGTRRYATSITPSNVDVHAFVAVATTNNDRYEQFVYDTLGREVYRIQDLVVNGTPRAIVTKMEYDANGNVIKKTAYANDVASQGYVVMADVVVVADPQKDRVQWTAYDQNNRAVFSIDALGHVTRNEYDSNGNVVAITQHANPLAIPDDATRLTGNGTTITAEVAGPDVNIAVTTNALDRTTRYWYDGVDRLRYSLDAENYLTEMRYDSASRTETTIVYATSQTISPSATTGGIAPTIDAAADQKTVTLFDSAGRVFRVCGADYGHAGGGYASATPPNGPYEEYRYDAVGNKVRYRNRNGAEWNYTYDANRRLVDEISPLVSVTRIVDGATLTSSVNTESITTRITYDALGNVRTRTEAQGVINQERTTTYEYDALGRQVKTIFPSVAVYGGTISDFSASAVENNVELYSEVTYDALGDTVTNRDVSGNYSHKAYDALGRVIWEVDAERYATAYTYDEFGNSTAVQRLANRVDSNVGGSASATRPTLNYPNGLPTSANDRVLVNAYDRLNRVIQVTEPADLNYDVNVGQTYLASPTTFFKYNAFGQLEREARKLNPAATDPDIDPTGSSWAYTYRYYDGRGSVLATVDPEGYVTRLQYDKNGNVVKSIEYANRLTGSWTASSTIEQVTPQLSPPSVSPNSPEVGYDREVICIYDQLNRKVEEHKKNVVHSQLTLDANGRALTSNFVMSDAVTTYGYDAVGNQTRVTLGSNPATDPTTYTFYDALGRTKAVVQASRDIDGSLNPNGSERNIGAAPLVEIRRDALGNVVEAIEHADNLAGLFYPTTILTSSADRHVFTRYNSLGQAIRVQDAKGNSRYFSYNARGNVAKEWQAVRNPGVDLNLNTGDDEADTLATIYLYDNVGRHTGTIAPQRTEAPSQVVHTQVQYNAFGEVEKKGIVGLGDGWSEYFEYDKAGRIWRTNQGDGVHKVYFYDLQSNSTMEIRSQVRNLKTEVQTAAAAYDLSAAQTMRTTSIYDRNARKVEERLPVFSSPVPSASTNPIFQAAKRHIFSPLNGGYYAVGENAYVYDPIAAAADPLGAVVKNGDDFVHDPTFALVLDQRTINWKEPTGATTAFAYSQDGGQTWIPFPVKRIFDPSKPSERDRLGANVNSLALGTYQFQVQYFQGDTQVVQGTLTGAFTIHSDGSITLGTTELSIQQFAPVERQSLDRWGNAIEVLDSSGEVTRRFYNQLNQLHETHLPLVDVVDTNPTAGRSTLAMTGDAKVAHPVLRNLFDVYGRRVAVVDGNGNINRFVYNEGEQLVKEVRADGGVKRYTYDVFGQQVQVVDEQDFVTRNLYDKAGLLTARAQEVYLDAFVQPNDPSSISGVLSDGVIVNAYAYDEAGRRVRETNGAGESTKLFYDLHGNLKKTISQLGATDEYRYDVHGNKVWELKANGRQAGVLGATISGTYANDGEGSPIVHFTTVNGVTLTDLYSSWVYDYFGRLTSRSDLKREVYTFAYNQAGLLTNQASTIGQDITYNYDSAGHVTSIIDEGRATPVTTGQVPTQLPPGVSAPPATFQSELVDTTRNTFYTYDASGRRTSEKTYVDLDGDGAATSLRLVQDTVIEFDSLGRIKTLSDLGYQGLTYRYDAQGNRTHIKVDFINGVTSAGATQNLWYTYDEMNRVQISQGVQAINAVAIIGLEQGQAAQGTLLTYDKKGQRVEARTAGKRYSASSYIGTQYSPTGSVGPGEYTEVNGVLGLSSEYYRYDGLGRLIGTSKETLLRSYYSPSNIVESLLPDGTVIRVRGYDAASRETADTTYDPLTSAGGHWSTSNWTTEHATWISKKQERTTTYDADGRSTLQVTKLNGATESEVIYSNASTVLESAANSQALSPARNLVFGYAETLGDVELSFVFDKPRVLDWDGTGFDPSGVLRGYVVQGYSSGSLQTRATHDNRYRVADSYQQEYDGVSTEFLSPALPMTGGRTFFAYNVNGEVAATLYSDTQGGSTQRNRYFINNAQGQAISSVEGAFGIFLAGDYANVAAVNTAFVNSMTDPAAANSQNFFFALGKYVGDFGKLKNTDGSFAFKANFDVNYTPVSEAYPGSMPLEVVAQRGDTLRSIAMRIYGDGSLWYVIAHENGLTDPDATILEGTQIRIPNRVLSLSNDSATFKPFNPADALGDVSPTQPIPSPPPQALQCRTLAKFIGVVVGVVVGIYSAGYGGALASNVTEQMLLLMFNGMYDWDELGNGLQRSLGVYDLSERDLKDPWRRTKTLWKARYEMELERNRAQVPFYGAYHYWGSEPGTASEFEMTAHNPLDLGAHGQFDNQAAGIAGTAGVVTAGFGSLAATGFASSAGAGQIASNAIGGAAGATGGYLATYGLSRAVGRDFEFSWRALAAGAVSGAITSGLSASGSGASWGKFTNNPLISSLIKSSVSYGVNRAFDVPGTQWNTRDVLLDAFGNAIGNSFVRGLTSSPRTQPGSDVVNEELVERFTNQYIADHPLSDESMIAELDRASEETSLAIADLLATFRGPSTQDQSEEYGVYPSLRNALLSSSTGSVGRYMEVGDRATHSVLVQLVGQAFVGMKMRDGHEFSQAELNLITSYSQWPDGTRLLDAKTRGIRGILENIMGVRSGVAKDIDPDVGNLYRRGFLAEEIIHSLNGRKLSEMQNYWLGEAGVAGGILKGGHADPVTFGLILHPLLDLPFHADIGDSTFSALRNMMGFGRDEFNDLTVSQLLEKRTRTEPLGHAFQFSTSDHALAVPAKMQLAIMLAFDAFSAYTGISLDQIPADSRTRVLDTIADVRAKRSHSDALDDHSFEIFGSQNLPDGARLPHRSELNISGRITLDSTIRETARMLGSTYDAARIYVNQGTNAYITLANRYLQHFKSNKPPLSLGDYGLE